MLTEAEMGMQRAEEAAKVESQRWRACKRQLKISTFAGVSDLDIGRAWRDLGFPLKYFMRVALRAVHEPLELEEEAASRWE